MLTIVVYPKCSTCRNAVKWLEENGLPFKQRHIVDERLSAEEIKDIHQNSGLPIKKFFNTSGTRYRELGLKDNIDGLSDEACYTTLASDGMLVKRPLAYDTVGGVTVGFKVVEYEKTWK